MKWHEEMEESEIIDDDDVNFIKKEIKITGKGNKQRIVPFGDELKNPQKIW